MMNADRIPDTNGVKVEQKISLQAMEMNHR